MTVIFSALAKAASAALFSGLTAAASPAMAQPNVETSGDFVIRASTVSAEHLSDAMRRHHGIGLNPNTGLLNVTVQRKADGVLRNVPARVEVRASNLFGVETAVEIREVVANDMVTYMGTYTFLPREVLDFEITAHPQGEQQAITLQFRDRLGLR